jgi:DNA-directed RNA polymerase specialized sigma24 family protein
VTPILDESQEVPLQPGLARSLEMANVSGSSFDGSFFFVTLPVSMHDTDLVRDLERQRRREAASWQATRAQFRDYQVAEPVQRVQLLGQLFEALCPWLERGIRSTALRHFLLLPTEMLLGRLFAEVVHRAELPSRPATFLMWVEGTILRRVADPNSDLGVTNGAPGEPPAELQARFHSLPYAERAVLYLAMMEGCDSQRVAERTGLAPKTLQQRLDAIWQGLQRSTDEQ